MRLSFYRILLFCLISVVFNASFAKNLDANGVIKAYTQWCAAIGKAQGNPQEVVKFYAPHAILLPTLSNKILFNDNGGLDDYFKMLTSYKNIQCQTKQLLTSIEGDQFATTAGFYNFIYIDQDGKSVTLPARFTFVYKKFGNNWLVIQHHSSMLPVKG